MVSQKPQTVIRIRIRSGISKYGTGSGVPGIKNAAFLWHFCMHGLGQPYRYGVQAVLLARKSQYIRSYAVRIYGSGQP